MGAKAMPSTPDEARVWIDGYLAGLPGDQRLALQDLRSRIAEAAPEAEEGISYGMPAFRYRGRPLVSYHAARDHCSFFPMGSEVLDHYRDELASYSMAKGTVRFGPDRPLPRDVVERIVRDRLAMIDDKVGSRSRG